MLLNTKIMKLKVGTTLCAGKYQIVRFINQGGFGCTYEGRHTMLNSRVAIKEFFLKDFCNRDTTTGHVTVGTLSKTEFVEKLCQRFIREAQVLNSIEHPGIVHVTDVFEENGTAYYVMNYIDGETLGELLKRRGPIPEAEAVGYIRQVCNALDYIHSRNHLHLDIKPSNIMVTREGKTVLIDFGTSKQFVENVGGVTTTNFGLTPGFAPPEQCNCETKQFCPATDIYALGATFHYMLTGDTPPDVVKRASGKKFAPLPKAVSQGAKKAIYKCLELALENRPTNVSSFLAILNGEETIEKNGNDEINKDDSSPTIPLNNKKSSNKDNHIVSRRKNIIWISFWVIVVLLVIILVTAHTCGSRVAVDADTAVADFHNGNASDSDTIGENGEVADTVKSSATINSEPYRRNSEKPDDDVRYRVTLGRNQTNQDKEDDYMSKYTVTPRPYRVVNGDTVFY